MDPQIIAAVIGAVATIAAAVIAWWLHEKKAHPKPSEPAIMAKADAREAPSYLKNRSRVEADSDVHQVSEKLAPVAKITVEQIVEAINSAPPFQKDQIAKQYNGIKVQWIGYLKEAGEDPRDKNSVRVNLNVSRDAIVGASIWFSEKIAKFPDIRTLKRGSEIRVIGEIIGASGRGMCVDVKPVAIEVLDGHA